MEYKVGDRVMIINGCYKDIKGTIKYVGLFISIKPDEPSLPAKMYTENEFILLT